MALQKVDESQDTASSEGDTVGDILPALPISNKERKGDITLKIRS